MLELVFLGRRRGWGSCTEAWGGVKDGTKAFSSQLWFRAESCRVGDALVFSSDPRETLELLEVCQPDEG